MSGTQTYVYKGEKNGVRSYEVRHTGTLSQLGDWEVEVRPDGLYMTGMTSGKMDSPEMELPAKLEVGNSWKSSSNFQDKSGKSVQLNSTAKVFSSEKVTVPAGTFDAIRIEQDGEGTLSGQKAKVRTKAWYVKDRGNVKTEVTTTPENGAVSTYIIQETN
jgi:hypothetical protein